jgi:hypothetical protein
MLLYDSYTNVSLLGSIRENSEESFPGFEVPIETLSLNLDVRSEVFTVMKIQHSSCSLLSGATM